MDQPSDHTGFEGTKAAREIMDSLERLDGVRQARLEPPDAVEPDRVHITMTPGWAPETVRRDVQALLLQRHDLDLDAASIHTAPAPPTTPPSPPPRPVLDAVHLALRSSGTSVGIELMCDDRRLRGSAGPVGPTSLLSAVAQATLRALEEGLPQSLEVENVDVVDIGSDRVAMATVVATDDRSRQRLAGSTIVRGNVEDAMARTVLDATNRLWRTPSPVDEDAADARRPAPHG